MSKLVYPKVSYYNESRQVYPKVFSCWFLIQTSIDDSVHQVQYDKYSYRCSFYFGESSMCLFQEDFSNNDTIAGGLGEGIPHA